MTSSEPMWIERTRGGRMESRHRVDLAVCDSSGRVVESFGDPLRPTQPRSAAKPIQALPLVLSGAADAFSLDQRELAMACASHKGEQAHVDTVLELLGRVGSGAHELECGSHFPGNVEAANRLIRANLEPGPEHNNCSGKHAGFLTTAHHMSDDPKGYLDPSHPVQRRVTAMLTEMTSESLDNQEPGIDGCGIPVWTMPLVGWATGWARLSDPDVTGAEIGAAAGRLLDAMTAEPWYVSGTDQASTRIMAEQGPRVAAKGGAEGVYCAVDRDRRLGIALKVGDGASLAAEVAIEAAIARVVGRPAPDPVPLHNAAGTRVGEVRVKA